MADRPGETRCVLVASAPPGPHCDEPTAAVPSSRSGGRGGAAPGRDPGPLRPGPFGGELGELVARGSHAEPASPVSEAGRCPLTAGGSVGRVGSPSELSPGFSSEGSPGSTTTAASSSGRSSREAPPRLAGSVPTPRTTCVTSASTSSCSVEALAGVARGRVGVRRVDSASSPDLSQDSSAVGRGPEFGVESVGPQRLPSHPVSLGTANWGGCRRADGCVPVMGPPEDRRRGAARGAGVVAAVAVASSGLLGV